MTNPDENRVREIARDTNDGAGCGVILLGLIIAVLFLMVDSELRDTQRRIGVLEQQVKELQQR